MMGKKGVDFPIPFKNVYSEQWERKITIYGTN